MLGLPPLTGTGMAMLPLFLARFVFKIKLTGKSRQIVDQQ